jgi:hypothetical protein
MHKMIESMKKGIDKRFLRGITAYELTLGVKMDTTSDQL